MTRLHPFDAMFAPLIDTVFQDFQAEQSPGDLDLDHFGQLPSLRQFLGQVSDGDPSELRPDVFEEYVTAIYVAYRFWRAGRTTITAARAALTPPQAPLPLHHSVFPSDAVYVELPAHGFWGQVAPDAPHEPVEGIFVVSEPSDQWLLMAILGLRREREGWSQVHVRVTPGVLANVTTDSRNPPFAPLMDGGQAAGFSSIASEAELVYLTHLALQGPAK